MSDSAALSLVNSYGMFCSSEQDISYLCTRKQQQFAVYVAKRSNLGILTSISEMDLWLHGTCGAAKTALIKYIFGNAPTLHGRNLRHRLLRTGRRPTRSSTRDSIKNTGLGILKRSLRKIVSGMLFEGDASYANHARSAGLMKKSMGITSLTARKTGTTSAGFAMCVTVSNTCRSNLNGPR